MSKISNRVFVLVELTSIGDSVVSVKLSPSLRLGRFDFSAVSRLILDSLLPGGYLVYPLFDGTYLVSSADRKAPLASCFSIPFDCRHFEFDATVELEDGLLHDVRFSLNQSTSDRDDYTVMNTRILRLVGSVSIEVDENETSEIDA